MSNFNLSTPLQKGLFWELFRANDGTGCGGCSVVLRWRNTPEAIAYLNYPLVKMLSVKSRYLSEIKDMNWSQHFIDILVLNNSGIPISMVARTSVLAVVFQIYSGYSHYFAWKEKYAKDLLLEGIFLEKPQSDQISILDFGVYKR